MNESIGARSQDSTYWADVLDLVSRFEPQAPAVANAGAAGGEKPTSAPLLCAAAKIVTARFARNVAAALHALGHHADGRERELRANRLRATREAVLLADAHAKQTLDAEASSVGVRRIDELLSR